MKKKELILDFTSLLDVIMILLFVVIINMNHASLSVNEEAQKKQQEAQSQIEAISAELEELKLEYNTLQDENDYLKITSNYDANDTSIYDAVIKRMTKVTLICNTGENKETGNYEVQINIYLDANESDEKSFSNSVIIEHNLNLSKDERQKINAEHVTNVTRELSSALRNVDSNVIWFSVQYEYDDENFSNSDLEIINEAIGNLERSFSRACYVDKIEIY